MASHKQVWRDALGGGNILTNNFDHGTPECLPKSRYLQIQERKWFIDPLRNHVGDRYPGGSCMKITKRISANKLTKQRSKKPLWHIEAVNMLASGWTSSNLEEVKETSNIFKPWASSFRIFECIGLTYTWYQFVSRVLEAVQQNPTKHANQSLKQSKRNHDLWSAFLHAWSSTKIQHILELLLTCLWSAFQTHPMNLSTSSNNPMNQSLFCRKFQGKTIPLPPRKKLFPTQFALHKWHQKGFCWTRAKIHRKAIG